MENNHTILSVRLNSQLASFFFFSFRAHLDKVPGTPFIYVCLHIFTFVYIYLHWFTGYNNNNEFYLQMNEM